MPVRKKAAADVAAPKVLSKAELAAEKVAARAFAHRQKRERVHKGLTNANVENPNG